MLCGAPKGEKRGRKALITMATVPTGLISILPVLLGCRALFIAYSLVDLFVLTNVPAEEICNFSQKVDLSFCSPLVLCGQPLRSQTQTATKCFQAGTDGWPRLSGNASSSQISLEPHKLLTDSSEFPQLTSNVFDM